MEAMSAITPATHRGSVVHSRPLSPVVSPCLQRHLQNSMRVISDIFLVLEISSESSKFSMVVSGFALPLVYRPRLLLCGIEGAGLDHLGPSILHELEKFPVHALGLSSLLSDLSAKTPEEALVHVFGEARRTTPSILYLPQFHLWWENAHDQLRAVLLTLLAELPSDSPILLLGTSFVQLDELDGDPSSVDKPLMEDRSLFFDHLIEAAFSIPSEGGAKKSKKSVAVPELSTLDDAKDSEQSQLSNPPSRDLGAGAGTMSGIPLMDANPNRLTGLMKANSSGVRRGKESSS
ncbi:unnamed protein product [Lactuca virosa]|uniref:Uncharacterized protein n=1 Tax=Lactuca virosa TaxID=75947 RepID=A0AAU9P121_9ASTR|nr:unnamed protein product [Lactuca virosa]